MLSKISTSLHKLLRLFTALLTLSYYLSSFIKATSTFSFLSLYFLLLSITNYLKLLSHKHVHVNATRPCAYCKHYVDTNSAHCFACSECVPNRDHHNMILCRCVNSETRHLFFYFIIFMQLAAVCNFGIKFNRIVAAVLSLYVLFLGCLYREEIRGEGLYGFLFGGRKDRMLVVFLPFLKVDVKVVEEEL